ncbi:MAG TPA: TMEM165/GDT1 family protein [Micromonosporaceae bacterium]|nr:TMEM165/GDT1 family protein [Micromonosporaceae bacterium]HKE65240.1 TMEM165/GDT1 family protein [Micromonosporaceae bacterium]
MIEFLAAAGTAFLLIVPVELPDKTFIATLILTTKYRPLSVWLGVVAAFFVQCVVAVAFGRLINLLPHDLVKWLVVALFVVGAILLFRSARHGDEDEADADAAPTNVRAGLRAVGASFLVLFAAEWGDLSQLLTAGLVAKGNNPYGTFLGSWLGLAAVSGVAVVLGHWLLKRVRLELVRYVAAGICAALAIVTAITG